MSLDDAVKFADVINKVCGAFIPLVVAIFGLRAYSNWRREQIGKERIELAKKVSRLAARFRNEFEYAVSARHATGAPKDGYATDNENSDSKVQLDERYAKQKCVERLFETLNELSEVNADTEMMFDNNLNEYLVPCTKATERLSIALQGYFDVPRQYKGMMDENTLQFVKDSHAVLYGIDRALLIEVRTATTQMQNHAKKHLK